MATLWGCAMYNVTVTLRVDLSVWFCHKNVTITFKQFILQYTQISIYTYLAVLESLLNLWNILCFNIMTSVIPVVY
jgi:hypothetical protein